jgi:hypothetical protein
MARVVLLCSSARCCDVDAISIPVRVVDVPICVCDRGTRRARARHRAIRCSVERGAQHLCREERGSTRSSYRHREKPCASLRTPAPIVALRPPRKRPTLPAPIVQSVAHRVNFESASAKLARQMEPVPRRFTSTALRAINEQVHATRAPVRGSRVALCKSSRSVRSRDFPHGGLLARCGRYKPAQAITVEARAARSRASQL